MILTLEVTGPEAGKLGTGSRKVFNAAGGTIGRLQDNSWVLPDQYVSGRHALIRYVNGVFYIEDTSRTNGVFINSPENRLARGEPYALKAGDRIIIEPYEIRASISAGDEDQARSPLLDVFGAPPAVIPPDVDDPFAPLAPVAPKAAPRRAAPDLDPIVEPVAGEDVDPLNLLGFDAKRAAPRDVPSAERLSGGSVLSEHYSAPAPVPAAPAAAPPSPAGMIPEDYNPLASDSVIVKPAAPAPAPAKSRSDAPPRSPSGQGSEAARPPRAARAPKEAREDGGLADVLRGAGLTNVPVTPELARSFGKILRVVVSGVMDVLQARQRIKEEFRIRVTTFKRSDNNPLKFSADVDHALQNLLGGQNAAYLPPVEAFEDAFADIRNHQMAMLAGVRIAFEAMLAEFDPDRLQEEFDRQIKKGGSLRALSSKMRYWELYRDRVHDMVSDADASFRALFGDEFAKAYEEQLERLRAQHRSGKH